jgi:hypothetical protein
MSTARLYPQPAQERRPILRPLFDLGAVQERTGLYTKQTTLPGCGPSPANKKASIAPTLQRLVRCHSHVAFIAPFFEGEAEDLMPLVQRLFLDDMLLAKPWRLELVRMGEGFPHYRLYHRARLAGIVDIPVIEDYLIATYAGLERLQWKLCLCLAVAGVRRDAAFVYEGEAQTPIEASKKDLPYLFS